MWVKLAAIFISHFPGNGKFIPIEMEMFLGDGALMALFSHITPIFRDPHGPWMGDWGWEYSDLSRRN